MVGEYYDTFVIVFTCVVVFSSRQCVCSTIVFSLQVVNFDIVVGEF